MTENNHKTVLTGGCQCGAIRFAVSAPPVKVSICHCRMCQKASGAPFASFADIDRENFTWTRGKPAAFRSSSIAERDFCRECGTPLTFRRIDGPRMHFEKGVAHCEDAAVADELEAAGYPVVRWRAHNLFFGGVSAVEISEDGSLAAAGDPRRGGAAVVVGA